MVVAEDDEVVVVVEVNIFEAEGNEAVASFIKPQIPLVTWLTASPTAALDAPAAAAMLAVVPWPVVIADAAPARPAAVPGRPATPVGCPLPCNLGRLSEGEMAAILGRCVACELNSEAILPILILMEPLAILTGRMEVFSALSTDPFLGTCSGCKGNSP